MMSYVYDSKGNKGYRSMIVKGIVAIGGVRDLVLSSGMVVLGLSGFQPSRA